MRFRPIIFLLVVLSCPFYLLAQVSFSTVTDELTIKLNGILQVQYVIENASKIEKFEPPVFREFKVMQGPMETTGMSLVNNQLTEYKALTYVLQPLHKGRLIVPGAIATINGKKMTSNKVMIEVGDAAPPVNNPYPRNPGISGLQQSAEEDFLLGDQESAEEKIKKNLLVKLDLDKTHAFIGEPVVATYKLYTRLRSESRVSKRPSMNGFSVYDMPEAYGGGPVVEKINGKPFMMHIIRKTQLIPLQDGSFTLDPVELENTVRFLRSSASAGPPPSKSPLEKMFSDLLAEPNGNWEDHKLTISSEARTIDIKPLPDGAPPSFNGAVGKFTIQGVLKDSLVSTGENATYELKISGSGNLPLVNAPAWDLPAGFNNFEPTVTEDINKMVAPMMGSKTFTYTLTADSAGKFTLPPIAFSYFDPASKTYSSLQTATVELTVKQGNSSPVQPTAIQGLDKDPGKNNSSNLVIAVLAFSLGMAGLILLLRKKKKPATVVEEIPMPEPILKKDPLFDAREAFKGNQPAEFYKAIEAGLWEAISDKMKLSKSGQQKPLALDLLELRGLSQENLSLLKECWKSCEWALYVPHMESQVDPILLRNAETVIDAVSSLS